MSIVKSIMTKSLITARPSETVYEAIQRMNANHIGAILVVENNQLIGIFSERDLAQRVIGKDKDPKATLLHEVATLNPQTVTEDAHIKKCVQIIKDGGFRHLPVLNAQGCPTGIISTRDFLQYIVEELELLIDKLTYENDLQEGNDPYDHIGEGYDC